MSPQYDEMSKMQGQNNGDHHQRSWNSHPAPSKMSEMRLSIYHKRNYYKPEMKPSDFVGLEYRLKHTTSKKAVIDSYPELKGKTIREVKNLIMVNTMVMTGKSMDEQRKTKMRQYFAIRRNYGRKI